jgi:hypothetical protein
MVCDIHPKVGNLLAAKVATGLVPNRGSVRRYAHGPLRRSADVRISRCERAIRNAPIICRQAISAATVKALPGRTNERHPLPGRMGRGAQPLVQRAAAPATRWPGGVRAHIGVKPRQPAFRQNRGKRSAQSFGKPLLRKRCSTAAYRADRKDDVARRVSAETSCETHHEAPPAETSAQANVTADTSGHAHVVFRRQASDKV